MDFNDWCKAVNACLKSKGKPFAVNSIDPAMLMNGFNQGQSPAVFAQSQAGPTRFVAPPVQLTRFDFAPNYRFLRLVRQIFTICAWIIWGIGAIWVAIWIAAAFNGAFASLREQPQAFAPIIGFGLFGSLLVALVYFLIGAVNFFIAQMINLWVRQQMDIEAMAQHSGAVP